MMGTLATLREENVQHVIATPMGNPHLTPSAQALLNILYDGREYTFKDLTARSSITPRTIRNAIALLRRQRLIIAKFNFRDGRQILYRINDPAIGATQAFPLS